MPNKDNLQIDRADEVAKKIRNQYLAMIRKISSEASKLDVDPNKPFDAKDYPAFNKMLDELMLSQASISANTINQATREQWIEAYEKNMAIAKPYLDRKLLTTTQQVAYQSRNDEALSAFQTRKINGMNLSDKVWNYNNQYKNEIEMSLDLALTDGTSAEKLSRNIRQYLNEPDKLFRRVRNKHGSLHLSKKAKAYNPGSGVYRSSYKNAMRLARTEINMAYRTADFEKYKQFDFVVGFEIKRSNNIYPCPLCEGLKGIYPKDFKFVGWHPQCRCYTVPILNSVDDFVKQQQRLLDGKTPFKTNSNEIKKTPENFNKWYLDNIEKINKAKNKPYFIQDNQKKISKIEKNK